MGEDLRARCGVGIGDRVELVGGFVDGLRGVVVGNEPMPRTAVAFDLIVQRDIRLVVELDVGGTVGGLLPGMFMLEEA